MSDLGLASPYPYGSPDDQTYNKSMSRMVTIPLSNMPVGALAQFLTNPDAPGYEKYVPGIASGLYSTADTAHQLYQHFAGGVPLEETKHLPGGEEAGKLSQGSVDRAASYIPHVAAAPGNTLEETLEGMGQAGGAVALPIPGAALARLPRALQVAGHVIAPGPRLIAPSMALSGGASALINSALGAPSDDTATGTAALPPSVFADQPQTNTTQTALPPSLFTEPPAGAATALPPSLFTEPPAQPALPPSVFDPVTQAQKEESGITIGEAILAPAVMLAVLKGGNVALKMIDSVKRDRFYARSAEINAATAANGGVVTGDVPLPGEAGTQTTKMAQYWQNDKAVTNGLIRATADTPINAEKLVATSYDMTNTQAQTTGYQRASVIGEMHGQQVPSGYDLQLDAGALKQADPTRYKVLNDALHAGNERDNRYANWLESGKTSADVDQRVRFPERDFAQNDAVLNAGLNDPVVKALMDRHQLRTNAFADMLVKNGMMSVSDGHAWKAAHQWYVPTGDLDNVIGDPMLRRNITPYSGTSTAPDVMQMMDQHDFQLYKRVGRDRDRANIVDAVEKWQNTPDPATGIKPAPLFQDSKNAKGEYVAREDKSTLSYRQDGMIKQKIVNNRQLLDAMKGNQVQTSAGIGAINKLRQVSQSAMTGPISIATGHIFPVINTMRSAGEMTVLRKAGMYSSHADKWMQQATGGRLSARGDPVTGYLGAGYHMIADPTSVVTGALGDMFHRNAPNAINQRMRALFGDNAVDLISKRITSVYENTAQYKNKTEGLANSAGFTAQEVRTSPNDFMAGKGQATMPSTNMVPELFRANSYGGALPTYVRLRNLFDEMRAAVGDAAHSNVASLNRGNPNFTPAQLKYEIRSLTGDPATHGAGSLAQTYSKTVPFGNVAIQEVARVAQSMKNEPVATTLAWITHYGTLALASVYTAMLAGPEAVQHLFDMTTDHKHANEIGMYVPGHPTNPINLPVQIEMRAPIALAKQMLYDFLSLSSHADNPDWAGRVMDTMHDYFQHHVWQSTVDGTVAGVSTGIPPVMPSGFGPAITALTGQTADPNVFDAWMHRDKPISKMFSYDITGQNNARTPGQAAGKVDPVTGTVSGGVVQHILSDVFAVFGMAAYNAYQTTQNVMDHGGSLGDVLHNITQDYGMRVADSVPGGNLLWGIPDKLTSNTPLQQVVEQRMDAIRPMVSWKSDLKNVGYTRAKGQELLEKGDPNTPSDPTLLGMYAIAGKYAEMLESNPRSPLKDVQDIRKQLASLERSPLEPAKLRVLKNQLIEQMQDKYVVARGLLHDLDGQLSEIAGVPVDVRKVKWKEGMEQFAAPPQQ